MSLPCEEDDRDKGIRFVVIRKKQAKSCSNPIKKSFVLDMTVQERRRVSATRDYAPANCQFTICQLGHLAFRTTYIRMPGNVSKVQSSKFSIPRWDSTCWVSSYTLARWILLVRN